MAACTTSDPGKFPENHAVEVEASVEDDEGCPWDNSNEAEEELFQAERSASDLQVGGPSWPSDK